MAAMKPRTGDGPLEVTKEGRGIVMRVPLEGGGRLVVELNAEEATASVTPSRTSSADRGHARAAARPGLAARVRPQPRAAAPDRRRRGLGLPGPPGRGRRRSLGPGADEAGDALGVDLLAALEASRATGRTGEVTAVPVVPPRPRTADGRPRAARRRRRADRRPTSVAPAPPWPAPPRTAPASSPRSRRSPPTRASAPSSSARCSARSPSTGAPTGPAGATGRPDRARRRGRRRRRRRARPGDRARRRRLALTHPGDRPGQPQDPGLAGRAGRRGRRGTPASRCRSGTTQRLEAEGFGGILAVGGGSVNAPRLIRMDYTPRGRHQAHAHGGAGRQGHHLRHRRPRHQAQRGHADDEARHERRRRGASPPWLRSRDVDCPVRVVGLVPAAENAVSGSAMRPGDVITPLRRSHLRGQQHRRRGPPRAGRRDGVRRRRARADRPRRHRHPDRRDEGGARPVDRRLLRQPRGPGRPAARPRRPTSGENALADAAGRRLRGQGRLQASPTATTPPAAPARSPPRCSSSTSPATCRGPTSTSPPPPSRRPTATSGPPARAASGPRLLLSWLGSDDPLAGIV